MPELWYILSKDNQLLLQTKALLILLNLIQVLLEQIFSFMFLVVLVSEIQLTTPLLFSVATFIFQEILPQISKVLAAVFLEWKLLITQLPNKQVPIRKQSDK